MRSLKTKTFDGLSWSFVDSLARQGIQFFVGIVLARLLSPHEFGLIGMLTIFIAYSQLFIDSGFSQALIRKKDCTSSDYSTIFFFNLVLGVVVYMLLVASSGAISNFYDEPRLKGLVQVLGLSVILNSVSLIHRTILIKAINFSLQAKISLISSLGSGVVAIFVATMGGGVWSLIALTLVRFGLDSVLLWIWTPWRPIRVFEKSALSELFGFGNKLLLSGMIYTTSKNIYLLIIGKYFSVVDLGFYTRADQFVALPSQTFTTIINRVTYPILSKIQDNMLELKNAYQRIIKTTMFLSFLMMLGLAAVAESLILVLVGEKWFSAVEYLQLLCFAGVLYPLHAINLNMLKVRGRSDLFLKLEIIKTILTIPVIFLGVFYGIRMMIFGMILVSAISFFINSYWSGILIGYSTSRQIRDLMPAFILALSINGLVYLAGNILNWAPIFTLMFQILLGILLTLLISEIWQNENYMFLKGLLSDKFAYLNRRK